MQPRARLVEASPYFIGNFKESRSDLSSIVLSGNTRNPLEMSPSDYYSQTTTPYTSTYYVDPSKQPYLITFLIDCFEDL